MEVHVYEVIGRNIKRFRELNKFSQTDLGEKIGLTRSSIANIETGRQKVQIDTLYQIAMVLYVEIEQLLPKVNEVISNKDEDIQLEFFSGFEEDEQDWLRKVILKGKNS